MQLGTPVQYIASNGKPKLAFVLGTPETISEGTEIPTLSEGQLHLTVFSPNGNIYPRHNVPSAKSVEDNPEFVTENGLTNVWKPLEA